MKSANSSHLSFGDDSHRVSFSKRSSVLGGRVAKVVFMRAAEEMAWANAGWIVAAVTYENVTFNRIVLHHPCDPVSPCYFMANSDASVSMAVLRGKPHPTASRPRNLGPETLAKRGPAKFTRDTVNTQHGRLLGASVLGVGLGVGAWTGAAILAKEPCV